MKVLVAEDNKESRYLLEMMLKGYGHEVTAVTNGAEALEQALAQPPDMIVSDILMPVMDGFQLCQECKQNEQLKNIPFIFYTATYTDKKDEEFAMSLGANAFILKPAEPDIFIKILSEEFEKARSQPLAPDKVVPLEPSLYLSEYNKRIVAKLEQKILALEREVTERKRARENLETEFRMRTTLLDNIPNCMAMILKKGAREVVASNRFARELGAVSGQTCFKTCFKRDDSCPFCLAPKLWATDQMQRLEVEYRETWYEGIWAPLSKDLYVHYIFDITERKRAEEKLRDAEASLKNTFDISPGLICVADTNAGYFTECNPAVTRILGISVEEFTSKPFMELVHPDDRQRTADEITEQLRGGTVANFENRYRCKDGSYKWLAWQATAADKNGKVHAVATDITDSKQIQEALRESEEKYRNLFENSKDAVYISSREGLFVDINQAFLDLFGFTKEEISEMQIEDIYVNPSDRIIFQQKIEQDEFVRDYELKFNKKDGEMECLVTATLRFGNDGNILGYQGIIRDITQKKRIETELKSTYKRLRIAHDQRRVLSKRLIDLLENDRREIARELHDHIGQTLTGLKMNLELTHKKLKPDQTELAAQIYKAQKTTIQVLKDTKNVIYGLRPILIEALGLVPALQELFNATTGIEIHFFTQRIPKRFQVDKELAVYRIVQESLNNVTKHAQAVNYYVNLIMNDGNLILSLEDDGVGFDPEDSMKATRGKGPLGLLIMQERAVQVEGDFTLESRIGKGTNITVVIPL